MSKTDKRLDDAARRIAEHLASLCIFAEISFQGPSALFIRQHGCDDYVVINAKRLAHAALCKGNDTRSALTYSERNKRRIEVLCVVDEIASQADIITAWEILQEVKARGIDLGVSPSREGTVISNIIKYFGKRYEIVAPGVYRKNNEDGK